MNLRDIRPWAQTWFALKLVVAFALLIGGLLISPFLWGWDGGLGLILGLQLAATAALALFVFFAWVDRDVRLHAAEIHRRHRHERPAPDGDLTDVAGAPSLPPWMGVGP